MILIIRVKAVVRIKGDSSCPECAFPYTILLDFGSQDVQDLIVTPIPDCQTCNNRLPVWAASRLLGVAELSWRTYMQTVPNTDDGWRKSWTL